MPLSKDFRDGARACLPVRLAREERRKIFKRRLREPYSAKAGRRIQLAV